MNMEIFRNNEFDSIRVIEETEIPVLAAWQRPLGYVKPRNAINTH